MATTSRAAREELERRRLALGTQRNPLLTAGQTVAPVALAAPSMQEERQRITEEVTGTRLAPSEREAGITQQALIREGVFRDIVRRRDRGEISDQEEMRLRQEADRLYPSDAGSVALQEEQQRQFREGEAQRRQPEQPPGRQIIPTEPTLGAEVSKRELTPLTNPSVVDFLNAAKLPSDYASRSRLAQERGITGYRGTADQNTRLLNMLRQEHEAGTLGKPVAEREEILKKPSPETVERGQANVNRIRKEAAQRKADSTGKPVTYNLAGGGTEIAEPGPAVTPKQEINQIDEEANRRQQEESSKITDEFGEQVDLTASEKLIQKLTDLLEGGEEGEVEEKGPGPLEQKFVQEREKLGIGGLETELTDINAQIAQLDADFASTLEEEEARVVSVGAIRRRQSAQEIRYNRLKRDLQVQKDSLVNQLNQKYGVLETMVKFTGMDYDNAQQDYERRWNQTIQLTNLIKGIEETAKSDQERKIDNARANAQIMYNLLKEGNVNYDTLDESVRLQLKNMEIQAGLPIGFSQFISENLDPEEPVISFLPAYTDVSGNRIQPVGTIDKNTGAFNIQNITLGQTEIPEKPGGFTELEERKLEQAGLLNAERQKQLDFLYKKKGGGGAGLPGGGGVPDTAEKYYLIALEEGEDEARSQLNQELGSTKAARQVEIEFNKLLRGGRKETGEGSAPLAARDLQDSLDLNDFEFKTLVQTVQGTDDREEASENIKEIFIDFDDITVDEILSVLFD